MTKIIPAIDLINGQCVRLEKGDYDTKKIYNSDPLEVAKSFEAHGITDLHLVDLDGAKAQEVVNHKILEQIASQTNLNIDFGGGIKSNESLKIALESGAKTVSIGSLAVKNPELFFEWIEGKGADVITLSADAKDKMVAISGWLEDSGKELIPFLQEYLIRGVKYATITDIAQDGMLRGPNFDLYEEINQEVPELQFVVSGGVKDIHDVEKAMEKNYYGIIIGKAIYEGKISLKDLEKYA